jgi:hypothetical protein
VPAEEIPAGRSKLSMKFSKTGNFEGNAEPFFDQSWKLPQVEEIDFVGYGSEIE